MEEEIWRCKKHPSPPRSGVCPSCLRDRLLRLCPCCANVRPCGCSASSSSSFSSFSSLSSSDLARSEIGAVGRVSSLIEGEPALRRSRSVAVPILRPGSARGWTAIWPFSKVAAKESSEEEKLARSRSVVNRGWGWHFPSPMRAFRHRKSAKVVHERSPMRALRN